MVAIHFPLTDNFISLGRFDAEAESDVGILLYNKEVEGREKNKR